MSTLNRCLKCRTIYHLSYFSTDGYLPPDLQLLKTISAEQWEELEGVPGSGNWCPQCLVEHLMKAVDTGDRKP